MSRKHVFCLATFDQGCYKQKKDRFENDLFTVIFYRYMIKVRVHNNVTYQNIVEIQH